MNNERFVFFIGIVYPFGELNIMGIYTDTKMLIEAYDKLVHEDARCTGENNPEIPLIYKIPLNHFLGEKVEWGRFDGKFYFYEEENIETVRKALQNNGITNFKWVDNQEEAWEMLEPGEGIDLIVTDMHYPLRKGTDAENNAGFILIEKMKEKEINIPVIICSSKNYISKDIMGTVWYSDLRDLTYDFKNVLDNYSHI